MNRSFKGIIFFVLMTLSFGLGAQTVTLTFTGRGSDNHYVRLNKVVINNLTKNWQEIIWWPDTTLTMQNGTGIENYAENGGFALSQNNPNPFSGTTDVSLTVAEEGKVQLEIADMNGRTVVESQNYTSLQPGNHQFRVSLSTIGAYVMTARQNGKTSSIKMICNGGFGTNAIDYLGETQSITYMLKSTTNKPFNYGDMMEYIGYATFNGSEVESQRITQAQGTSQTFTLQFAATQLPNAPTGVAAAVSGTQIHITWNSVYNAISYKVYRSSSANGSYTQIGTPTSNNYYDANPLTGYNYYKVKAVNTAGESDYSPYTSCNYVTAPDAPTGVTATVSGSQIYISWGFVSNASSYKVYRSSTSSGTYSQIGSATSSTYLYDSNPLSGYNYYKVKAVNSAGESDYSQITSCNYSSSSTISSLPYSTNFYNDNTWTLNNGTSSNYWAKSSTYGLFVTNDGTTPGYDITSSSTVMAEKLLTMSSADSIHMEFNVQVGGESSWDYLKVFLAPSSVTFTAGADHNTQSPNTYSTYAVNFSDFKSLTGYTSNPYTFNKTNGNTIHVSVNVANPSANGTAKLVFLWRDDTSAGEQPGAVISQLSVSESSSPCDAADQCTYTFNLTDSYGDGWNGGVLSVQQNGVTVASITLSEGSSGTETVNLCNNISTSLLWNPGSYNDEVGFSIEDPSGNEVYSVTDMDNYSTYTFMPSCSEIIVPASGSTTITTCNSWIYDNGGSTGDYQNNSDGYIVVTPATTGQGISLEGTYDVESNYDHIYVYAGVGTSGTQLGSYSGSGTISLTNNGTVTIRFTSDNSVVNPGFAIHATCASATAPSAPTGVTATVSGSQIYISWNSVSNATSYKVYRSSSSSGSYTLIGSPTTSHYYDASPLSGYNYYKVKAVNSSGESSYSSVAPCDYSGGGTTVPTVTTSNVSDISTTTASCGGNVTSNGGSTVTARGVCWSTSQNPTVSNSHTTNGSGTGSFTSSITGLSSSTTYYVRAYATNSAGTAYGTQRSFTTEAGSGTKPTVTTNTVSNVSTTTATCGGNVTSSGSSSVTVRGVCWSTSQNPTVSNSHTTNGSGTGSFTSSITGLSSSTTYYVRAYATNSAGTAYGTQRTFTTEAGSGTPPTVTTNTVSNVSTTTATCGGNVTSSGSASVTARGVCWSTSQNPIVSGSHTTNGSGTGSFTSSITGLTANTTYYVRAYATNSAGTAYGAQKTFTTTAGAQPTVTTNSVSGVTSTTATCGGNVTSAGGTSVTARGVCWSTSQNPTVSGSHTTNGSGTGSFTSSISGLNPSTTYYVRAYATNSAGTAYGTQKTFTTAAGAPCPPSVSVGSGTYSQTISWTVNTGSGCGTPTSFQVWQFIPCTNQWLQLGTTSSHSYVSTSVYPGVNQYKVVAVNSAGTAEGTANSSSVPLSAPSGALWTDNLGNGCVQFSWSAVDMATGYEIWCSTNGGSYYLDQTINGGNVTTTTKCYPQFSGNIVTFKIRAFFNCYGLGPTINPVYSSFVTGGTIWF